MGKRNAHYIDNRAFTAAMREYQDTHDPELLSDITVDYLIPLAEAVANNWSYLFSEHHDLTQEALAAGIKAINHPNAANHAFNFFTKVFRNRMLDMSRSDSNRAQKSRNHLSQWETGYIRESARAEHTSTDDIIANCILNGDGTTRTGQASVSKIAAETGLDRKTIESYLAGQKERLQYLLRPSERVSVPMTAPQPVSTPTIRYAYTQTTLSLEVIHEAAPIQKLHRKRLPRAAQDRDSIRRRDERTSNAKPFRRGLRKSGLVGLWC